MSTYWEKSKTTTQEQWRLVDVKTTRVLGTLFNVGDDWRWSKTQKHGGPENGTFTDRDKAKAYIAKYYDFYEEDDEDAD